MRVEITRGNQTPLAGRVETAQQALCRCGAMTTPQRCLARGPKALWEATPTSGFRPTDSEPQLAGAVKRDAERGVGGITTAAQQAATDLP